MSKRNLLLAALVALAPQLASAHVTLDTTEAVAGSYQKIVLRVPHGCAGSPTTGIRVQIPEGAIAIKPQPKPGWQLSTKQGDYAHHYELHNTPIKSGVKEVQWSGGSLADEHYDEFVLRAYLAADLSTTEPLRFPVIQECETGIERWIDQDENAAHPAPALRILPKE
ncbi:YcnI family copper-binding membrane protein [Oceanisphaera avium]|uniref:YncI copper-binding domain-containing protein n=1 Tax=Oceanisphaera avium TaxID=1903694 RepID=A0A1Y0CWH9_9GAMM|nr:DUF1775 domain-containing protein [Oceanisphaera avium]ART79662.1 hypothetical protein CBP12_05420 [Oceanisphaera avium]